MAGFDHGTAPPKEVENPAILCGEKRPLWNDSVPVLSGVLQRIRRIECVLAQFDGNDSCLGLEFGCHLRVWADHRRDGSAGTLFYCWLCRGERTN